MSFLNLWALWIAAAVVPALLILYFLKLRRREQVVASTLLWKRAVQDLQVNAPFQKLRKNLLLFLQMLLLALGIFALARPIIETEATKEKSLILLIDRSASMETVEAGGKSRLDLAKEQATRLVRTLNQTGSRWFTFSGAKAQTRVMVIAFADRASVISPFTTNTADLVDLIENITPTDARTNLREAFDLAQAYLTPTMAGVEGTTISPEQESRVILFSDGGVEDLQDLVLRSGKMEFRPVGETRDNVGITVLRTQRNYERPEQLSTFLQVRNSGPAPVTTDVSLYIDGRLIAVQSVNLAAGESLVPPTPATQPAPAVGESPPEDKVAAAPPRDLSGSTASLTFPGVLETGGLLEARIARTDALAADNRAYVVVPPPRKLRVLLVSAGNFFWESVLRGLPLESLEIMTPEQYESAPDAEIEQEGQSRFDVVVLDKHSTARLPVGAYLFVRAAPQIEAIKVGEEVGTHAMMWWDESHAVLRHVSLDAIYAGGGITVEAPPEAETLIEGPAGPALLRYSEGGRQYLILTFAVENSTWWNRPGFPVFAYNALRYLGSGGAVGDEGPTRPGDTLRIQLPAGEKSATVHRPDGSEVEVAADARGTAYFGGTREAGVYRVEPGLEHRDRFAVNLEDEFESDITPHAGLTIGGEEVAVGKAIETATPEIWRWFIGAALALALLEWYIYNRRVMI